MSGDGNDRPTVFVSYSHRDEAWKDRLRPHLAMLERLGLLTVWDDRQIDAGAEWYERIFAVMDRAVVSVCLVSADYLASEFCTKEEIPYLLERRARDGMALIPVLVRPCAWKLVPWLKPLQMIPRDGKSIAGDYADLTDEVFAGLAESVAALVAEAGGPRAVAVHAGAIISDAKAVRPDAAAVRAALAPPPPAWPAPERVDIGRLPVSGAELFGRAAELNALDAAWDEGRLNVVSLVAWGGVGKTTLVNRWLGLLAADNYRGARRVYAWSFYSQGTGERGASADLFIAKALAWFGDPDPTQGSPWDKGERLARLIRAERTLLVLDGLEPLQSGLDVERGKVKDPGLATLLECLAGDNPGLCLVTTREPLADLDEFERLVHEQDLEQLSPRAGRALLRTAGVRGTDAALEQATEAFGRSALALALLGAWLAGVAGHDIARAGDIPDLDIPEREGRHPRRVMAAFAARLGEGQEVEALRLLGLFDRPAGEAALRAVREGEALAGLTEHLSKLDEAGWRAVVEKLRDAKLVAPRSAHRPNSLDAHPHVRTHFGEELEQRFPETWREANSCLYEHYRDTTEEFPDTLEGLTPLYQAVQHGCRAGRHQDALEEVFYGRIRRGGEGYSWRMLGAFSADLSALAGFFARPWDEPRAELSDDAQAFLQNEAGIALRALGRLGEAAAPMEAALERRIALEHWANAARIAGNLSELHGARGTLERAEAAARRAVELAERSGEAFVRVVTRTQVADVLHQASRLEEAAALFEEAERMQREEFPRDPLLCSLRGYLYCDLLLARGEAQAVSRRAEQTLEVATLNGWLLDIALDRLSLGRAALALALAEGSDPPDLAGARADLDAAVEGLRRSGNQDEVPRGLLARAALHRAARERPAAERDLAEALKIATRAGLRLHAADAHLEYARLHLDVDEPERARPHYETAARLVEACGYHRRDPDLAELAAALGAAQ